MDVGSATRWDGVRSGAATVLRALRPRIAKLGGSAAHLWERASLWSGLVLGASAALVPAVVLAQPGRVALVKFGIAIVLTVIPGWLYAVYLNRRGPSLYDEFVINLFRLEIDDPANLPMPPEHTRYHQRWSADHAALNCGTKDNLYRRRFEGVYGRKAVSTREAFKDAELWRPSSVETFSPVVLATLLVGIGWALTLQPELLVQVRFLDAVQLSGLPVVPVQALQFAFVGTYAFLLQDLVRRYFVVDLRNTAYVAAVSRIVLVTLVVAVLYAGDETLSAQDLAVAFVLGFFPRAALQALEARTVRPLGRILQGSRKERQLAELDGLDIWQETRMVELGIENMEQFATTDLVEVLLRSRTPVERLVGWLDRAFLLLLLPDERKLRGRAAGTLRGLGIRSATDLDRAVASGSSALPQVAAAMGMEQSGLELAVESLRHQANYFHVRAFRSWSGSRLVT